MANERLLIVEDEPAVARGLEYALMKEGFEVFWAKTGEQALQMMEETAPQLLLLDIRLPGISGYDVCRRLRAEKKRQPILMLTARDEEIDKILGLELGADDYVVKPFSLREVISRVRALLRRAYGDLATITPNEQLQFGDLVIDMKRLQVTRQDKLIELTPIEFRLLRYLASNPNRALSRSQLIETIWGYDSDIYSERTVDAHIRHLRAKLEDDSTNPQWLKTVRGVGYMFEA